MRYLDTCKNEQPYTSQDGGLGGVSCERSGRKCLSRMLCLQGTVKGVLHYCTLVEYVHNPIL